MVQQGQVAQIGQVANINGLVAQGMQNGFDGFALVQGQAQPHFVGTAFCDQGHQVVVPLGGGVQAKRMGYVKALFRQSGKACLQGCAGTAGFDHDDVLQVAPPGTQAFEQQVHAQAKYSHQGQGHGHGGHHPDAGIVFGHLQQNSQAGNDGQGDQPAADHAPQLAQQVAATPRLVTAQHELAQHHQQGNDGGGR